MQSLLAIYGEGVAKGINCFGCCGLVGALGLAAIYGMEGKLNSVRKCLWTALVFAIVLTLFPAPDFFKAMDGRP